VPLSRDFRAIVDLEMDDAAGRRVFMRLLDARIMRAFGDAVAVLAKGTGVTRLEVTPSDDGQEALRRLGGPAIGSVVEHAAQAEREVLDRLDSVLPPDEDTLPGHGAVYSLRALSGATVGIEPHGRALRPLVMLDDGHELAPQQREMLLEALHDRELDLARWYTERYSAMKPEDLVGDGEIGRSNQPVWLEHEARQLGSVERRGSRTRQFERLLADIANRRARGPLHEYAEEERRFTELLATDVAADIEDKAAHALPVVSERVLAMAGDGARYEEWLTPLEGRSGYGAVRRWRELEVLIARDRERPALGLFEVALTEQELRERSGSSIREAADLFLRREFGIPFYAGPERIAKLSAENIEQYLRLCGELFDSLLVRITLREPVELSPSRQDRAVVATSEEFWRSLPQRRSGGRQIQRLLKQVAHICRSDTYRPTAPYSPGVTGTALSMRDRERLLDPRVRARLEGAQELFEALSGAIGHNLLRAELDRSVKNNRWMVLYLNRLICARYGLPLGYGGFRERPLEAMCQWMLNEVEDPVEAPVQEALDLQ
jgi:hypothetical protein